MQRSQIIIEKRIFSANIFGFLGKQVSRNFQENLFCRLKVV